MENQVDELTLSSIFKEYEVIKEFSKTYNKMNFVQFDYHIVHHFNLFSIKPDLDFYQLEQTIDYITKFLPTIKKIFSKPLIHLIEQEEIQPVESVRSINQKTMIHIAGHSELWDNIDEKGIKPQKLLTKIYQDNFGIYENIVFCNLIDTILVFVRKNIRLIKDLIYTNQSLDFNLLERVNHINYFLALGKLHTGYIRNFEQYYNIAKSCLNKLNYINEVLTSRLKRPIYRYNKNRPEKIKLRKTNILMMHKDYHQIYLLAKHFDDLNREQLEPLTISQKQEFQNHYQIFCSMLLLFSIGHLNFTCDLRLKLDIEKLHVSFHYKNWKLSITTISEHNGILLSFEKNKKYSIFLISSIIKPYSKQKLEEIKNNIPADEYIVLTPYEYQSYLEEEYYIGISNIDSFRRLQQLILRGMILSQEDLECPFCKSNLVINQSLSQPNYLVYECEDCRTRIIKTICPETKQSYCYTEIINLPKKNLHLENYTIEDKWIYERKAESQMYFRNITKITDHGEIICPICHQVHQTNH